ncbi:hypothetical protein Golax_016670, partial [Gossypium laxum]|nr:hypothetical protein [Gossypium laxum]
MRIGKASLWIGLHWTLSGREEEGSQKRKRLIEKLVKLVDCLWERKPVYVYKELISMEKLKEVKRALLNSTFYFSSMYRSWIPKPNKPGKLRAITQPNKTKGWGQVDRLIKSDIVGCFDNIDHELLINIIQSYLGKENQPFFDLILAFLKTPIVDKKGRDLNNNEKGIPQGSPLSPVMMNIFLHQLDIRINSFMEREKSVRYL